MIFFKFLQYVTDISKISFLTLHWQINLTLIAHESHVKFTIKISREINGKYFTLD